MSYEVNRTNFFLSTSQRQAGGSPSDFTIPMFKPLTLSKPTNYFKIKFNTISMPYSFKQLEEYPYISGCSFSWNGGVTTNFNMQFEPGNYNINEYLAELSAHLIPELLILAPTNDLVYDFSYNQAQGWVVLTITSPSNTPFNLKLGTAGPDTPGVFDPLQTPYIMTTILGFQSSSTGVVFNAGNPTNSSVNQINCSPISALFLRSINLRVVAYESLIEKSVPSDILCKIDIITQPRTIINWWNNIDIETKLSVQVIDNLSFQLTAINSYNPINMHGSDFYIGLSILEYNDPVAEALVNQFNSPEPTSSTTRGGNPELSASPENEIPTSSASTAGQIQNSTGEEIPALTEEETEKMKQELENLKSALRELDLGDAESIDRSE